MKLNFLGYLLFIVVLLLLHKNRREARGSSLPDISQFMFPAVLPYFLLTARLFLEYFSLIQQRIEYVKIFWCVSSQVLQPQIPCCLYCKAEMKSCTRKKKMYT